LKILTAAKDGSSRTIDGVLNLLQRRIQNNLLSLQLDGDVEERLLNLKKPTTNTCTYTTLDEGQRRRGGEKNGFECETVIPDTQTSHFLVQNFA
jgi:hypothetical protein